MSKQSVLKYIESCSINNVDAERQNLTYATGMRDRQVRECIEQLRVIDLVPIVNGDIHGYKLASDKKDVETFRKSIVKKIEGLNALLWAIDKWEV